MLGQVDTLIGTLPISEDKEIVVKLTEVDGLHFLNIREYIPSLDQLGRGLLIPEPQSGSFLRLLLTARSAQTKESA